MNRVPLITSGTGLFKAVCHRCQYVGFEPNSTTCATCGFPLLLEPYQSARLTLQDIFDRSAIELKGRDEPTPLPGVNRTRQERERMLQGARQRMSRRHSTPAVIVDHTAARALPAEPTPVSRPLEVAAAQVERAPSVGLAARESHAPDLHQPGYQMVQHAGAMALPIAGRSFLPVLVAFLALVFTTMVMTAATGGF